jgi:type IV secretion system protein VirD4
MPFDTSNLPITGGTILGIGVYVVINVFGAGPFVNDRELAKMNWLVICEANLQAEISMRREPTPVPAIPELDCQSTFGLLFGRDGQDLCRNYGNFEFPIPDENALREQERRAREAEDRRIERAASQAGSRCECASAVYQAEQIIPLAIYSGSARTIIPPQVRNIQSELTRALRSPQTTASAVPWLLSLMGDHSRAVIVNDCKNGEIAAQCADACARFGRKVAIIDGFGVLGKDNPYRVSITPFGGVIAAHKSKNGELIFATETANHALISKPANDARNQYWRDEPRTLQEFAELALLKRHPKLAVPGGVWAMLANSDILLSAAKVEKEEGDEVLSALGAHIVDMAKNNKEHFGQHRGSALKSLRIYSAGSPLHHAGVDAEITHAQLLREKYVVFIVGPQRHMARLGAHYALHLQSFVEALLSDAQGQVDFILDEATNAPLKALVSALTTMRGFGGNCHFIVQSRSEIQRAYGEKETATIEENAVIKQWFGFSSFE